MTPENVKDEAEQPRQPVSKEKSSPKPQKTPQVKAPVKVKASKPPKKAELGDSTPRVSAHPQPGQPGPSAEDVGKTTDTRAPSSKKAGSKKDQGTPHPVTTPELVEQPTAAQVAEKQPLRQSALPTPTERIKVEGQPVTVIAEPHLVDPTELMPHRADTVIKDTARTEGLAIAADAPVNHGIGGDILEGKPGETKFKVDPKSGDLTIEGGVD